MRYEYNILQNLSIFRILPVQPGKDPFLIGSFLISAYIFSIFLLEILNMALQSNCEAILEISSKNIENVGGNQEWIDQESAFVFFASSLSQWFVITTVCTYIKHAGGMVIKSLEIMLP